MALEPNAYLFRTTTLEAINMHLSAIGVSNVSSLLAVDKNVDVEAALRSLLATAREVQMTGWHYNTYRKFVLNPVVDTGVINLPSNCLRVESAWTSEGMDLVERDGQLWDNDNNTLDIGKSVYVDYVALLPFEEIPEYGRWYITVRSVRRFATNRTNSQSTYQFTAEDERKAMADARASDSLLADRTLSKASKHINKMRNRRTGGR